MHFLSPIVIVYVYDKDHRTYRNVTLKYYLNMLDMKSENYYYIIVYNNSDKYELILDDYFPDIGTFIEDQKSLTSLVNRKKIIFLNELYEFQHVDLNRLDNYYSCMLKSDYIMSEVKLGNILDAMGYESIKYVQITNYDLGTRLRIPSSKHKYDVSKSIINDIYYE